MYRILRTWFKHVYTKRIFRDYDKWCFNTPPYRYMYHRGTLKSTLRIKELKAKERKGIKIIPGDKMGTKTFPKYTYKCLFAIFRKVRLSIWLYIVVEQVVCVPNTQNNTKMDKIDHRLSQCLNCFISFYDWNCATRTNKTNNILNLVNIPIH
jgi:hypothetical protein